MFSAVILFPEEHTNKMRKSRRGRGIRRKIRGKQEEE